MTDMLIRMLLLFIPAGLFIYSDKKLLISNKIQEKFKMNSFLGLYAFIIISLVLSTFIVGTIAMILSIPSNAAYIIQTILIGTLLGLFSNIQKILRRKAR